MWLLQIAAATLLVQVGCGQEGPDLSIVSGTVTFDGRPLDQALVFFQPESGRPAMARTDAEGHYELKYTADRAGTLPGRCQVYITAQTEDENGDVARKEFLPARYHRKSELFAEVEAGKPNVFDFKLTSQ